MFLPRFNFNCGFNHVSHTWPDTKFNEKAKSSYFKLIGATTIELCIKVCNRFACFFTKWLLTWQVLTPQFSGRINPKVLFISSTCLSHSHRKYVSKVTALCSKHVYLIQILDYVSLRVHRTHVFVIHNIYLLPILD